MQNDLLRYSCQVNLPGFGEESQQRLQQAKVLIVGAGGLGCPSAQYLAAAGIGTLGIADFDTISIGNLHRQILYTNEEVGLKKALVATKKLQLQNPQIKVIAYDLMITSDNVMEVINDYDIVVDGTDNFDTRYLLNDACVLTGKPLVYGAIYQYEGQVAVWNLLNEDGTRTPNYRDVFNEVDASKIPNCVEGGVIPTLAGMIGCMQANEVLKLVTKSGELLAGKMLMLDAQTMRTRIIKIGPVTKTNITTLVSTDVVPSISVEELKQMMNSNEVKLIDVRTAEERAVFNISGEHIPLDKIETHQFFLENNDPVIFYCASGKRSGEVVKQLKKQHPGSNIFSLKGGIKAWREEA